MTSLCRSFRFPRHASSSTSPPNTRTRRRNTASSLPRAARRWRRWSMPEVVPHWRSAPRDWRESICGWTKRAGPGFSKSTRFPASPSTACCRRRPPTPESAWANLCERCIERSLIAAHEPPIDPPGTPSVTGMARRKSLKDSDSDVVYAEEEETSLLALDPRAGHRASR